MFINITLGAWAILVVVVHGSFVFHALQETGDGTSVDISCEEGKPVVALGVNLKRKHLKRRGMASFAGMEAPCKRTGTDYRCEFEPRMPSDMINLMEASQSIIVCDLDPPAGQKDKCFELKMSNDKSDVMLRQADMYCKGLVKKPPFGIIRGR